MDQCGPRCLNLSFVSEDPMNQKNLKGCFLEYPPDPPNMFTLNWHIYVNKIIKVNINQKFKSIFWNLVWFEKNLIWKKCSREKKDNQNICWWIQLQFIWFNTCLWVSKSVGVSPLFFSVGGCHLHTHLSDCLQNLDVCLHTKVAVCLPK